MTEFLGGKCDFCGGRGGMCLACARSYDRFQRKGDDGSVYSSMAWAAFRSARFARKLRPKPRKKR